MNVSVAAGLAFVVLQSGQGNALCSWDSAEVVTLAAAPASGQSRNDRIIIQVRDNAIDSGGNNDFIITSVTGTPATTGSQTDPAMPANAFLIASVTVPGAVANLNTATLFDRRIGPWITPIAFSSGFSQLAGFTVQGWRVDGYGRGWARGGLQYTGSAGVGANIQALSLPSQVAPAVSWRFPIVAAQATPVAGVPFCSINSSGQLLVNVASTVSATNPWYILDSVGPWDCAGPFW
jgi:hypothetical protein